jgi:hypothetical protein
MGAELMLLNRKTYHQTVTPTQQQNKLICKATADSPNLGALATCALRDVVARVGIKHGHLDKARVRPVQLHLYDE